MQPESDTRPPRGALAIVAIGLLATVAAALLSTDESSGSAAQLEWVQMAPLPDSRTVPVPGGKGSMRLVDAGIRATGTNVSGYSLYRVAATLQIDAGSPVGGGRILCATRVPRGTEIAQTPDLRATYPRSSEELVQQEVPEVSLLEFSSHGTELAVVELEDLFANGFAQERGVKVEWPTYRVSDERLRWFLPSHPPARTLELPFATIWRTTAVASVGVACSLTTSAGTVTARTAGALDDRSPPIDEEAEDRAREEEEEEEDG